MTPSNYIHGTAPDEQRRLATLNRLTNRDFIDYLRLRPTDRVLEVGSGLGILASQANAMTPRGGVTGVEFSCEQLAAARSSFPAFRLIQGDAHALPIADKQFDVVYGRYILEHVADPVQALREMRRVLVPGGRALVQENNILVNVFYPECPKFDAVWRRFVELQKRLHGDALIGRRLLPLFQQAGFERIELSIQPEVHWSGTPNFRPWVVNLRDNVLGAAGALQAQGLAASEEIEAVAAELDAFVGRDDATAIFYWNRAEGYR